MPRVVDVVRRVAPQARPTYIAAFERGDALLIAHGVTTPARLTHFLAQVLHETDALRIDWENMSYGARRLLEVFGNAAGLTVSEAQGLAHQPEAIAERVYGLGNPRKARELGNIHRGDGFGIAAAVSCRRPAATIIAAWERSVGLISKMNPLSS